MPLKHYRFYKYSCYGNSFVLIDETGDQQSSEQEKCAFAGIALDMNFGIGADNLLIIQKSEGRCFEEINQFRSYWRDPPIPGDADFIFRMLEPDGSEAHCCGNGLLCAASHLCRTNRETALRIYTEIPLPRPRPLRIGVTPDGRRSWVVLRSPDRIPGQFLAPHISTGFSDTIDRVPKLPFDSIRESDRRKYFNEIDLPYLAGYAVYTGEPHLVIFVDNDLSVPDASTLIFPTIGNQMSHYGIRERRKETGDTLLTFINRYVGRRFRDYFPSGINLTFAKWLPEEEVLINRCVERGINKEALACGTGALASAFVAKSLGLWSGDSVSVWPYLCRRLRGEAEIVIEPQEDGWRIYGAPSLLFTGIFRNERLPGIAPFTIAEGDPQLMDEAEFDLPT